MADLLKASREYHSLMVGSGLSSDELDLLKKIAQNHPDAKFTVPTPGSESKLNGIDVKDVSALISNRRPGQPITKREILEGLGGNPKSSRDQSKIAKVLPLVPEIEIRPGQKAQMLRRLADSTDKTDDETEE
jgi:hypothetical protein